jgi:hypothetical protein
VPGSAIALCCTAIWARGQALSKAERLSHQTRISLDRWEPWGKRETEATDIYDDEQREEILKEDETPAAETGFMQGRETESVRRKGRLHKDTVSVELAEDEFRDE